MRAIASQRCSAFPPIKSLLSILPNAQPHISRRHPLPFPPSPDTKRENTNPTLSASPPLFDIFSSHFVDRGFPVVYVSFRTFSKWHWKNSRAHTVHGDAAEPNEASSPPSRRPRGDSLYDTMAPHARGSPVPYRASPLISSVSSRWCKLPLLFIQE